MLDSSTVTAQEAVPGSGPMHGWALYLDKISVSFDGFRALNNLSLYFEPGELRCVIGPNGAGKTTMMDVITGKTRPDSGQAFFGNNFDLLTHSEPEIANYGIGRKFQKPTVFGNHTVLENLELAGLSNKHVWPTLVRGVSAAERERIDATLKTIGLSQHTQRLPTARFSQPVTHRGFRERCQFSL